MAIILKSVDHYLFRGLVWLLSDMSKAFILQLPMYGTFIYLREVSVHQSPKQNPVFQYSKFSSVVDLLQLTFYLTMAFQPPASPNISTLLRFQSLRCPLVYQWKWGHSHVIFLTEKWEFLDIKKSPKGRGFYFFLRTALAEFWNFP